MLPNCCTEQHQLPSPPAHIPCRFGAARLPPTPEFLCISCPRQWDPCASLGCTSDEACIVATCILDSCKHACVPKAVRWPPAVPRALTLACHVDCIHSRLPSSPCLALCDALTHIHASARPLPAMPPPQSLPPDRTTCPSAAAACPRSPCNTLSCSLEAGQVCVDDFCACRPRCVDPREGWGWGWGVKEHDV